MADYETARTLGQGDGEAWASKRGISVLRAVAMSPDVASKEAIIRLLHFLRTTFEDDPLETRLREALGVTEIGSLEEAQAVYETAWLSAVSTHLATLESQ